MHKPKEKNLRKLLPVVTQLSTFCGALNKKLTEFQSKLYPLKLSSLIFKIQ